MSLFADAVLVVVGSLAGGIAYVAWRNRPRAGTTSLAATMLPIALWAVTHLLEHHATAGLDPVLERLRFAVLAPLAFAWFAFVLAYTGRRALLSRRVVAGLFAWPGAIAVLVWLPADVGGPLAIWPGIAAEQGLAFWGHVLLSYGLLAAGSVLLLQYVVASRGAFRSQGLAVLAGVGFAWVGSVVAVLELFDPIHLHALPVGFVAMGGCFLWAVLGPGLTRVAPIARRRIIQRLDAGVLAFDDERHVVSINPAARALLDVGETAVVGRPMGEVFADRPDLHAHLASIVPGGEGLEAGAAEEPDPATHGTGPETAETADGGATTLRIDDSIVRCDLSPLHDDRDRLLGSVLLMHDVTERRRRREHLERQNERLDQFASVVSHDLRNPLSVAMGHLSLEREDNDSDHLETASDALERMEALIDDLRTLTRSGQAIDETRQVTLSSVAGRCWEMVDGDDAALTVEDDLTFEADPDRLVQLLENLFRNAVDHAGPDVSVRVGAITEPVDDTEAGTATAAGAVGFYVADDGPGIPADARDRIFESGHSTADEGTGFGLAIVERIADAHGWTIAATEGERGGARFEITGID